MRTAQDVLEFITKYANSYLVETKKETDLTKYRLRYTKYNGMKEIISAVINEMKENK